MLPARPGQLLRLPREAKPVPGAGLVDADYARGMFNLTVAGAVTLVAFVLLQLIPDKGVLHWLASAMQLAAAGGCAWLHERQRRLGETDARGQMLLGIGLTLTALTVLGYVGPFTAGVIVLAPLAYAYGFAPDSFNGWIILTVAAAGYFVIGVLALAGVPMGLYAHGPITIVALTLFTEVGMVATFVIARKSRRVLLEAFVRAEQARRELERRDVELSRARAEMDRMLDIAAVGRLTGQRVGPYDVGEIVGRGGMGEVYRAWRNDDRRPVALKVLNEVMAHNPIHVERFFREARISSALDSPHIIKVHDAGWAEGGYPYLAMDLLRGRDLGYYLEDHHRLAIDEVVELVRQVAIALEAAHQHGIVHRDLKPENLFLASERDGQRWVVLDFGISKAHNAGGTLTGGALIGTPNYMSPEQASGRDVDHRSDVFALGCLAYCALTGRLAFDASEPLGALAQVLHQMPPPPSRFAKLDSDVDLVMALALAKDRDRRIDSAAAFAQALLDALDGMLDDDLRIAALALLRDQPWAGDEDEAVTVRPALLPRRLDSETIPLMDVLELTPETLVANTIVATVPSSR